MIDSIVQEVREARAQIAADFGHDRARFWAWARSQQAAERKAKHQLPTSSEEPLKTTGGALMPPVIRKQRVRRARVAAESLG
jgi:hypothetical protein